MHSTDIYEYYVTPETPIISSVMAACPDYVPPSQYFGKVYSECAIIYWSL